MNATATATRTAELTAAIAHLTPLAAAAHTALDEARTSLSRTVNSGAPIYNGKGQREIIASLQARSEQLDGALNNAKRMLAAL